MDYQLESRIWYSDPEQEFKTPYDYSEQEIFFLEVQTLLDGLLRLMQCNDMKFSRDDRSRDKAVWMLHFDALDALREALLLLRERRHSIASRLFRDVLETIDLAAHLSRDFEQSRNDLEKWYADEIVQHRRSRESLGQAWGEHVKTARASLYKNWSRFTHRSYWAVSQSFGVGIGDKIWHDSILKEHGQCIPQIVASYLPLLANLTVLYIMELAVKSPLKNHELFKPIFDALPMDLFVAIGSSYFPDPPRKP
jgi:hypothetical protein